MAGAGAAVSGSTRAFCHFMFAIQDIDRYQSRYENAATPRHGVTMHRTRAVVLSLVCGGRSRWYDFRAMKRHLPRGGASQYMRQMVEVYGAVTRQEGGRKQVVVGRQHDHTLLGKRQQSAVRQAEPEKFLSLDNRPTCNGVLSLYPDQRLDQRFRWST